MKTNYSRKEIPGLTFVFSLPDTARNMDDFCDTAPCTLWKPEQHYMQSQSGQFLLSPTGQPISQIHYQKGEVEIPFGELKRACVAHADQFLPWSSVYELRLALPMGLDDPLQTFEEDIWRVGYVHMPEMTRRKEQQGMKSRFGYYLLEKHVAGTPLRLDTPPKIDTSFLGEDRSRWKDRFKRG